jgi:hypothetical protein
MRSNDCRILSDAPYLPKTSWYFVSKKSVFPPKHRNRKWKLKSGLVTSDLLSRKSVEEMVSYIIIEGLMRRDSP